MNKDSHSWFWYLLWIFMAHLYDKLNLLSWQACWCFCFWMDGWYLWSKTYYFPYSCFGTSYRVDGDCNTKSLAILDFLPFFWKVYCRPLQLSFFRIWFREISSNNNILWMFWPIGLCFLSFQAYFIRTLFIKLEWEKN